MYQSLPMVIMLRKTFISSLVNPIFAYGRRKSFQLRSSSSNSSVGLTKEQEKERLDLLKEIYLPLRKFNEGTREWKELLESGKVWEEYFQPFKWCGLDYAFQEEYRDFLKDITELRKFAKFSSLDFLRRMTVSFSQQSCFLEGNSLSIAESQEIYNALTDFSHNLDKLVEDPNNIPSPELLGLNNSSEVIEIRNQLLATHYLTNCMSSSKCGLNPDDLKKIHCILLKDTSAEKVKTMDGTIQSAGEFRRVHVGSYGYHLTVYSHPAEVPALMKRYMQFYDDCTKNTNFHPLILRQELLDYSQNLYIHLDLLIGRFFDSVFIVSLVRTLHLKTFRKGISL